jgi:plasmid stabilization system protein ParE
VTPRLSLRDDARHDIAAAAQWYEDQRPGLGFEFTRAVRATLAAIEREPQRYPLARGEVRRALLRRFPYAVYFIADPDRTIVVACLHVRRDPQVWQTRASGG